MAGSMKDMLYVADDGNTYTVRIDESNGEAFGFTNVSAGTAGTTYSDLPRRMQMRYVLWQGNDVDVRRKFWCGTPTTPEFVNGGNVTVGILSGNTVVQVPGYLTYAVGEKRRLPRTNAIDTGLNDGDPT